MRLPPISTLFPTRRSSDLISIQPDEGISIAFDAKRPGTQMRTVTVQANFSYQGSFRTKGPVAYETLLLDSMRDRKSTRLNSSHQIISYAVFCLKKKITQREDLFCAALVACDFNGDGFYVLAMRLLDVVVGCIIYSEAVNKLSGAAFQVLCTVPV